jgi:hypothetical protein
VRSTDPIHGLGAIGPQGADGRVIESIFLLEMRLQLFSEPSERSSGLRLVPVPERGAGFLEHRGEAAMDCGHPADHRISPFRLTSSGEPWALIASTLNDGP